jgi:hypothetical protein
MTAQHTTEMASQLGALPRAVCDGQRHTPSSAAPSAWRVAAAFAASGSKLYPTTIPIAPDQTASERSSEIVERRVELDWQKIKPLQKKTGPQSRQIT